MIFKIYEAKSQLSKLIEKAMHGEEIIICKGAKPMVKLVPIPTKPTERELGAAKGQAWMSDDFNEPMEEFKEYM